MKSRLPQDIALPAGLGGKSLIRRCPPILRWPLQSAPTATAQKLSPC